MILKLELGATDLGSELGAKICGSELGAKICGSEVPATYAATLYVSNHLGAKICGAKMCNFGATSPGGRRPTGSKHEFKFRRRLNVFFKKKAKK